jgi:hypothetical protein
MQKLTLVATVTHDEAKGRKAQKIGGTVTLATVKLSNGVIVAGGKLGGKYTAEQVLTELRRNPGHFHKHAGWDTAALAGLVR